MRQSYGFRLLLGGGLLAVLLLPLLAQATQPCGADLDVQGPHGSRLLRFARELDIRYPKALVNVVNYMQTKGRLPSCFLSKRRARERGWTPGSDLWRYAPGHSIGGNRFGNRERRLPPRYDGAYREADLDYAGGRRGARRLVFVSGRRGVGPIWVTVDHYRSFRRIPRP